MAKLLSYKDENKFECTNIKDEISDFLGDLNCFPNPFQKGNIDTHFPDGGNIYYIIFIYYIILHIYYFIHIFF